MSGIQGQIKAAASGRRGRAGARGGGGGGKGGGKGGGNAFGQGKTIAIKLSGKKDVRNKFNSLGVEEGCALAWATKATLPDEEAHMPKFIKDLEDPQVMEEHQVSGVFAMKGSSGTEPKPQAPGSEWPWRVFVFCPGKDNNTEEVRAQLTQGLVDLFNRNAIKPYHKYPRKARCAGDKTEGQLCTVDTMLLDSDVIAVMQSAHPDKTLEEIMGKPDLMKAYWAEPERGATVMREFIDSHIQEGENADDDEEEDHDENNNEG